MDRVERKVAADVLDDVSVGFAHHITRVYRVAHNYRDGLTEKEHAYLMKRYDIGKSEIDKLHTLALRLKRHG